MKTRVSGVVVGGAGEIGREISSAMAGAFRVTVADVDRDRAKTIAKSLPGEGHSGRFVDVTDERSVIELFRQTEEACGPVTAVVCAAGGTVNTRAYRPLLADTPLQDWVATEALNARGSFLCVREFLRCRREKPVENGRIVLISSLAARVGWSPAGAAYGAAKAAVIALTRFAAHEASAFGITVNAICPGSIDTAALRQTASEDELRRVKSATPAGRIGAPRDIANAVKFLLSPASDFVTGTAIDVNGGRLMG